MPDPALAPFLAHIAHCHNTSLPGDRVPFRCEGALIGWIAPRFAAPLQALPDSPMRRCEDGFAISDGRQLERLGRAMAEAGLYRSHNELFDVFTPDGAVLGQIDRGALPPLGIAARGVHLNGLVGKADGLHLWMGHRAMTKRLDPGKLDHLGAGGVCAGLTPREALAKEAEEEASIPLAVIQAAREASILHYTMERPEGLRRDALHCYDLDLPADFQPTPSDGEVSFFELVPLEEAFVRVRDSHQVKFNVNLVLIDLFIRKGLFSEAQAATLRAALNDTP